MEDVLLHSEYALHTLSTENQHLKWDWVDAWRALSMETQSLQQDKEDALRALSMEKEQKQAELLRQRVSFKQKIFIAMEQQQLEYSSKD